MALTNSSSNVEALPGRARRINGRVVYPHPTEPDVFVLEHPEVISTVRQHVTRTGGAVIKYTVERPAVVEDPVPLLIVPGYGGIKPAYRELRKAVVQNGKTAVTFKPPRTQERFAALHPRHFLHPERLLAQAVLAISKDLIEIYGDEQDFEQIDAAGHSMGGPGVINAAMVRPRRFRTVTSVAGAGLDGHTLLDMAQRAPGVFSGEFVPSITDIRVRKDGRAIRDMAHYVGRNPWRTAAEGLAVGSGDVRDKVTVIGMLGVKTAALQFANDHFFPIEGVREHSEDRFDLFREFPDPNANHMWPQLQPEAVGNELINIVETLAA